MQANTKVSIKTLYKVFFFCLIFLLVLFFVLFSFMYRTRDYMEVTGRITELTSKVDSGIESDSQSTLIHEVHCSYSVNNVEYQIKYRTFFPMWKNVNDSVIIYCSREMPRHFRDPFFIEACILSALFLALFLASLIWIINVRKNNEA